MRAAQQQEQEQQRERERLHEREQATLEKQREAAQDEADRLKLAKDQQAKDKQAKDKADQARSQALAADREKNLRRMLGQAGANGSAEAGTALRDSAPSASYAGRIVARIHPHILFDEPLPGHPVATVEVTLAPDGTIVAKRLLHSSGFKSWDDAVLRAIERTQALPLDNGRVPPPFQIDFKLYD